MRSRKLASILTGCALLAAATLILTLSPTELRGEQGASGASGAAPQADGRADLEGQVILITGSTGGLGREVAYELGARGAHVIVHGRSEERGREVVERIEAEGPGTARFYRADLASFDEVRAFGDALVRDYDRLDVLVHNAGVWVDADDERQMSHDGHELHMQVNYFSTFLLTELLLPLLEESAPARIVNVASAAQRELDFDDIMMDEDYSDGRGYAQSKLAQILFTKDLAERLADRDISAVALHPATMMDTDMVLSRGAEPRASVDEGTEAVMYLITDADVESGAYYNGLTRAEAHAQAYDPEARAQLRQISQRLTAPWLSSP
jgi:NAD(P)-dependent dehydrogenase (short-subunit alcohol dehydrogenase family)